MGEAAKTTRTFPTGWGQSDTHALTLSDGRQNPSASAGLPYETITGGQIVAMVKDPPSVEKDQAQWFLPSDYHDADARSHEAQRTHGAFSWLVADIDKGNPSLEAVRAALDAVAGDASRLIYSSRSAKPDNQKWRVLIPLNAPINGEDYPEIANAFFDQLEADGLICDRTLSRPGQLIYLPNRGEHYQCEVHKGERLKMGPDHPIMRRAEDERQRRAAVEREAQAQRDRKAAERVARNNRTNFCEDEGDSAFGTPKGASRKTKARLQEVLLEWSPTLDRRTAGVRDELDKDDYLEPEMKSVERVRRQGFWASR